MSKLKSRTIALLNENKFYIIYFALLFAVICTVVSLVPFSGDDWAWGSEIGLDRLHSWFKGYNGRYSGNLVVLALTRSNFLRSVTASLTMTFLCFSPLILSKKKSKSLLAISTFLMLTIPKPIFVQGIFWTAGFANYVPPVLLAVIYLVIIRDIFGKDAPEYSKKQAIVFSVISAVISFIGAMFVENATIYLVCLGVGAIVYSRIRFKKIYPIHISFLAGAILGTAAMFSNSVYSSLQGESDGYRVLPGQNANIFDTFLSHASSTALQIFANGFILCIIISFVCIALFKTEIKCCTKAKKRILISAVTVNLVSLLLLVVRGISALWRALFSWLGYGTLYSVIIVLIMLLYCVSVFYITIVCVKDKLVLHRIMLLGISAIVLVGPMLIIEPFGPRVLAPSYICLALFGAMLFGYMSESVCLKERAKSVLVIAFSVGALASLTMYGIIYGEMKHYDNMRLEYIEKQIDLGYKEITVCNLPSLDYLQCGDLNANLWQTRYKKFHKIDTDIKFKVLSPEDFENWAVEFDRQSAE